MAAPPTFFYFKFHLVFGISVWVMAMENVTDSRSWKMNLPRTIQGDFNSVWRLRRRYESWR